MANRKEEALARIYRDGKEITVKLERKPGNALEFYPVPGDSFYLRWSEGFKQKMKLVGRNIDEWFLPFAVKSSYSGGPRRHRAGTSHRAACLGSVPGRGPAKS